MIRQMLVTLVIVASVYLGLLLTIEHPLLAHAAETSPQAGMTIKPEPKKPVVVSSGPVFHGPQIVGISEVIDLTQAESQVARIWQQLLDNQALVNNVKWLESDVKVYALYSDFDESMSRARLSVGFDVSALRVKSTLPYISLPQGQFERFQMDNLSGRVSNKAWSKAHVSGNLIERHTLNRDGNRVSGDVIVVEQARRL